MAVFYSGFGISEIVLDTRLSHSFLCSALLEFGGLVDKVQMYSKQSLAESFLKAIFWVFIILLDPKVTCD